MSMNALAGRKFFEPFQGQYQHQQQQQQHQY
jgi:hypothetical protein